MGQLHSVRSKVVTAHAKVGIIIVECLSARQLFLHHILERVCVCTSVSVSSFMNAIAL